MVWLLDVNPWFLYKCQTILDLHIANWRKADSQFPRFTAALADWVGVPVTLELVSEWESKPTKAGAVHLASWKAAKAPQERTLKKGHKFSAFLELTLATEATSQRESQRLEVTTPQKHTFPVGPSKRNTFGPVKKLLSLAVSNSAFLQVVWIASVFRGGFRI